MLIERFDVENNCVLAEVDCYGNKGIRSLKFSRRKKDFSRYEISFTDDVSKGVIRNKQFVLHRTNITPPSPERCEICQTSMYKYQKLRCLSAMPHFCFRNYDMSSFLSSFHVLFLFIFKVSVACCTLKSYLIIL